MSPRLTLSLLILIGTALSHGCRDTAFPTWQWGSPANENRRYQLHDPFPDSAAGPDTLSRPRGYEKQRTEARQAVDNTMPYGFPGGASPMAPQGNGSSSLQYPESVPY